MVSPASGPKEESFSSSHFIKWQTSKRQLKDCTESKIRSQVTYSLGTFRKIKMKEWPLPKESAMLYQDFQKWLV